MKIAIACSGLGHISRGIETWAEDSAHALHRAGQQVTLFQGAGKPDDPRTQVIPCSRRFEPSTQAWVRRFRPFGGWRYGMGSGYQIEQTTFALRLWPLIRRDYDILHVQDPHIALIMERLHRMGLSHPRVILAHGTEEDAAFLSRFTYLQHLAPCYLESWMKVKPSSQRAFAAPNFVDVERFSPGDKAAARDELGLPQNTLIVFCAAAIKRHHKRIDVLVREFDRFRSSLNQPAMLVVAGGKEADSDELIAESSALLGKSGRFMLSLPREKMPLYYRAADIFAIASLHEMMPIAMLEALSSGLPAACNSTETLRWMTGPAGCLNDISREGALAEQLERFADPALRAELSSLARKHAVENFSEPVVVKQMLDMYRQVMDNKE